MKQAIWQTRNHRRMLTLGTALVIGLMLAVMVLPFAERRMAVRRINSVDASERTAAWRTLFEAYDTEDEAQRIRLLNDVNIQLLTALAPALLRGVDELEERGIWGWDWQPPELIMRGVDAQIRTNEPAWLLAATDSLYEAPLSLDVTAFLPRIEALLTNGEQPIRDRAFDAALAWAGLYRVNLLAEIGLAADDHRSATRLRQARRWSAIVEPSDVDATSIPPPGRRLDLDLPQIRSLLELKTLYVPSKGTYSVLVAEGLPHDEAVELAREWILDFNDDRKRSGAMLATLLDSHVELLQEAYDAENMPAVHTILRLALNALGADPGPGDPIEFAYRVVHNADGGINPEITFLLLCAGHRPTLSWVSRSETGRLPSYFGRKQMQLQRFAPQVASIYLNRGLDAFEGHEVWDALEVLGIMTIRHLRFDQATRTFLLDEQDHRSSGP